MTGRCRPFWLVAGFLLAVLHPQTTSAQTGPFCGGAATQKCIVSVTTTNPATPASITAGLQFNATTGVFALTVMNTAGADPFELSPALSTASVVTVVFKAASGGTDPKIAASTGLTSSWTVNTSTSPHHYLRREPAVLIVEQGSRLHAFQLRQHGR